MAKLEKRDVFAVALSVAKAVDRANAIWAGWFGVNMAGVRDSQCGAEAWCARVKMYKHKRELAALRENVARVILNVDAYPQALREALVRDLKRDKT